VLVINKHKHDLWLTRCVRNCEKWDFSNIRTNNWI